MESNEILECYVTDVAARLPRPQRNDVAFELRALLEEELQARANAAGRHADSGMAIELLHNFGHPAEVAARYRPALTIIDPADGQRFLRATVIGLMVIWCAGLLESIDLAQASGLGVLNLVSHWWGGTVIPSLWWPGVLVVGFATSAWSRRRWPDRTKWKPRTADRAEGSRLTRVMGLLGIVFGAYVLINPHWVLDFFWNGNAAPAAYAALSYTESFLHLQAPILLGLILLNIPLSLVAIVSGRHSVLMQRFDTVLTLLTCAAMIWTVADGPILQVAHSDQMAKVLMVLVVICVLIDMALRQLRKVRPTPAGRVQISR